jgi:phosphoribosylformylglycinamidine cyclo-ligase
MFRNSVAATHGPEVLAGVGAFSAAFAPKLTGLREPVLLSSTDSLGTKTILHSRFSTWEWAGRDVIGCVVNDILVSGARPLFFLDYLALNKVVPEQVAELVGGVAAACGEIGCALIGGEIAEMNDVYQPGDFDLVGFAVGIAEREKMLGAHLVKAGDVLIGLNSSGVHCNGFSLVRRSLADIPDEQWLAHDDELGSNLRESLLQPTRCYAKEMSCLVSSFNIHAAAHITGGGLIDNLPRVLGEKHCACVSRDAIEVPPIFAIIQRCGNISDDEMWHVFNMGVGFVVIVEQTDADAVLKYSKEHCMGATLIGEVANATDGRRFMWRS